MTERTYYNTDHLSDEEVRAVCSEVHAHYMAAMSGDLDENDLLSADTDELHSEYMFWVNELEKRSCPYPGS